MRVLGFRVLGFRILGLRGLQVLEASLKSLYPRSRLTLRLKSTLVLAAQVVLKMPSSQGQMFKRKPVAGFVWGRRLRAWIEVEQLKLKWFMVWDYVQL